MIGDENRIILRKLKEAKSQIDHRLIEKETKQMQNLSQQLSLNAGRIPRHPFLKHDNPMATFY